MSWVQFTISHGPGHQSETIEYVYFPRGGERRGVTLDARIKEHMEECMDLSGYDWPIVHHKKMTKLPELAHQNLVEEYHYQRDSAIAMLDVLAKTKTVKEYVWRCPICSCKPHMADRNRACPMSKGALKCPGKLKREVKS
jgi:hypothetical protein